MEHAKYKYPNIWLSEQGVVYFIDEKAHVAWTKRGAEKYIMRAYVEHGSQQLTRQLNPTTHKNQISRYFYYSTRGAPDSIPVCSKPKNHQKESYAGARSTTPAVSTASMRRRPHDEHGSRAQPSPRSAVQSDVRHSKARLAGAALVLLVLLPAFVPAARASAFQRLAPSIAAFASDGDRYAAWQVAKGSPIVVLDTHSGRRASYSGCSLVSQGEPSLEQTSGASAAAGRFLVECQSGRALLTARTGTLSPPLPHPAGPFYGEWLALGARYVEGNADPHDCTHSPRERRGEESPCIALYRIATGTLSYRPASQIPDLDRPGAPTVCPPLRGRLANDLANLPGGEFSYRDGLLAQPVRHDEARVTRIGLKGCHGHSRTIATSPEPRDLLLARGLLSWDTGHDATGSGEGEDVKRGRLWVYDLATRRSSSVALPPTRLLGGEKTRGVFGYSSHAGRTLFWIAARTVAANEVRSVETSSVYARRL